MELDSIDKVKRRNLVAIAITKLIHGFGNGLFAVVYQPYLLELTNSIVLTGLFITIGSIMQFVPMPLIGKLTDKYNRKHLLISSIPIYIVGLLFLVYANPSRLYLVIFGITFYFLGMILNNVNAQFLVAENSNKSKGTTFGFVFFSFFFGNIVASIFIILGKGLSSRFYIMFFISLLLIEGIIFIFFINVKTHFKSNQEIPNINNKNQKKENMWKKIFKTKSLRSILIFFTLDIFVYSISLSIYTGGLYAYYNLSKENIAFIILWSNIVMTIFQIPAGRITDKIGNKKTLIMSQYFGLGFFFMNTLSVILWMNSISYTLIITLSIGYILLALSVCTFIPAEQVILTNLGEGQKAETNGIVSFFRGIGLIPTGFLGGLIVENLHYIAPFIFSIIGIIIEILFLIKYFHD